MFVADMTEDKAVELASKVVSEGFLYGVRTAAAGWCGLLCCLLLAVLLYRLRPGRPPAASVWPLLLAAVLCGLLLHAHCLPATPA